MLFTNIFSTYLYLWGALIACLVYFIIFIWRKDLRKRMFKIGIGAGIAGIFSEGAFSQDYWHPPLLFHLGHFGGIEDFLFGLAAGGIGATIYDVAFHKRFRRKGNPHYWIIPVCIVSELLSIIIFFHIFRLNSIFASAIGFLVPALIIVVIRKDLIIETLASAVLGGGMLVFAEMAALFFAPQYLQQYYDLYGKVPLIFGFVPLTEFIWGASFAAFVGPLFDFDYGDGPINFAHERKKRKSKR